MNQKKKISLFHQVFISLKWSMLIPADTDTHPSFWVHKCSSELPNPSAGIQRNIIWSMDRWPLLALQNKLFYLSYIISCLMCWYGSGTNLSADTLQRSVWNLCLSWRDQLLVHIGNISTSAILGGRVEFVGFCTERPSFQQIYHALQCSVVNSASVSPNIWWHNKSETRTQSSQSFHCGV